MLSRADGLPKLLDCGIRVSGPAGRQSDDAEPPSQKPEEQPLKLELHPVRIASLLFLHTKRHIASTLRLVSLVGIHLNRNVSCCGIAVRWKP